MVVESVSVVNVPETTTDKNRVFTIVDKEEMNGLKLTRDMSLDHVVVQEKNNFSDLNTRSLYYTASWKKRICNTTFIIAKYVSSRDTGKYNIDHYMR